MRKLLGGRLVGAAFAVLVRRAGCLLGASSGCARSSRGLDRIPIMGVTLVFIMP